jgi:hypothetical protein
MMTLAEARADAADLGVTTVSELGRRSVFRFRASTMCLFRWLGELMPRVGVVLGKDPRCLVDGGALFGLDAASNPARPCRPCPRLSAATAFRWR